MRAAEVQRAMPWQPLRQLTCEHTAPQRARVTGAVPSHVVRSAAPDLALGDALGET